MSKKKGSITAQVHVQILNDGVKVSCPVMTCHWFEKIKGKRTIPLLQKSRAAVTKHLDEAHALALKPPKASA